MSAPFFHRNSIPFLTAIVIGATIFLLIFLIPDQTRVLQRAYKDRDYDRIEKILAKAQAKTPDSKDPLYEFLTATLDLRKEVASEESGRINSFATRRLADICLGLLGQKEVSTLALELLADTLAHSNSDKDIQIIASKLPQSFTLEQTKKFWQMVEDDARRIGNPTGEVCAAIALSNGSAKSTLQIARLWELANQPAKATAQIKDWFDRHLGALPDDAAPLLSKYIQILRANNQNSEALDLLTECHQELGSKLLGVEVIELIAQTALASGRSPEVIPTLKAWLRRHADDEKIWLYLSDMAMGSGDQKLAATAIQNYLRLHPDDEAKQFMYAKALEWSGQPDAAFDAYLPLAAGGSRLALDRLMALATSLHRETELTAILPKFLPEKGTSADLLALANAYVLEGNYADARKLFIRHLEVKPDDLVVLQSLAEIDVEDQLFADARALYERALKIAPEDSAFAHKLVNLDWLEGRFDGIIEKLRTLAEKTKDPLIIQQLYTAAESLGDYEALIHAAELKIATDPQTPATLYRNLSYFYTVLNRNVEALDTIKRGQKQFPASPYFRQELVLRLLAIEEKKEALQELSGWINEQSPRDMKILYVTLLVNDGKPKDALKFLQGGFSVAQKKNREILQLTGELLETQGRYKEAEMVFRDLLKMAPDRVAYQLALARALGGQHRERDMRGVLASIDLAKHPEAMKQVAQVYLDLEDYRAGAALLRRYVTGESGKDDALAWRMLGDATLSTGDPERAKRAYRKALQLASKEITAT